MCATSYKSIIESGGSDMGFVFHVHGYPWAVCTSQKTKDILDAGDAHALYLRRKMFGSVDIDGSYPADTVKVFATLSEKLGVQKTKSKTPGVIDVSGWSVEIYDRPLGASFDYIEEGDELWGLDGLHRTPNLNRDVHGWGFLSGNLSTTLGAVPILEESEVLYDRIDSISTWKPLWIGHECIAVKGINTGSYPEYTAVIGARGVYRSKNQYHFTRPLEGVSQKIADVPGSIAGHYCQLWAIPMKQDGSVFLDSSDMPVIASEREGVVSTDVGSNAGVTSVRVLSSFQGMNNEISYSTTNSASMHLSKFIFCRGESGTEWDDIYSKGQKPHLTIIEYRPILEGEETYRGVWFAHPIWICAKNDMVVFDTIEEVVDALNLELSKTYLGTPDSTGKFSESTVTAYQYRVCKEILGLQKNDSGYGQPYQTGHVDTFPMWYLDQVSGGADKSLMVITNTGSQLYEEGVRFIFGKWSECFGPLQLVLGLGTPHVPGRNFTQIILNQKNNSRLDCFYAPQPMREELSFGGPLWDDALNIIKGSREDTENQFMHDVYTDKNNKDTVVGVQRFCVTAGLNRRSEVFDLIAPEDFYVAKYFYQWDWVNYTIGYGFYAGGTVSDYKYTAGILHSSYDTGDGEHTYYIEEDSITDQFPIGSSVDIGHFTEEILTTGSTVNGLMIDLTDNPITEDPRDCAVGSSLICIPAYCLDPDQDIFDRSVHNDSWEPSDDPFSILLTRSSRSALPADIFKAFLGYNDTGLTVPLHEQRLWIPFFRTDGDFVSQIDWDNLDSLMPKYNNASVSSIPSSSFNMLKALDEELKLYGLAMCEDWDHENNQKIYRFRHYGDVVTGDTVMRGRTLGEADIMIESVEEDHNDIPLYNEIRVNYKRFPDLESFTVNFKNQDVFSLVQRDSLVMEVSPVITKFTLGSEKLASNGYMNERMIPILNRVSEVKPTQKRGVIYSSRFRSTAGREIIMTDPAAHNPQTHRIGLVGASCFVVEQSVDLTKGNVKIAYLVAGDNSVYGYAPACRFDVADVTTGTGEFTVVPEDRYGCADYYPKDIFFFDTFDTSDPDNPVTRASTCDYYAVLLYFQDEAISADNPLPGTCEVFDNSGTWTLRVYCDETKLPASGKIIMTYAEFDDVEDCQEPWIYFSDANGSVGTVARRGDTWK